MMNTITFDWSQFRIMGTGELVEFDDYVVQYVSDHPECTVHVGCDSQNVKGTTVYVTTVVFRYAGQGAHVLYKKEKLPKIPSFWNKLWGETERSVDLAGYLSDEMNIDVTQIDLDYNTDPSYPSQKLYVAASGYVQSMGYAAKAKPDLLMAVWAANVLCH